MLVHSGDRVEVGEVRSIVEAEAGSFEGDQGRLGSRFYRRGYREIRAIGSARPYAGSTESGAGGKRHARPWCRVSV